MRDILIIGLVIICFCQWLDRRSLRQTAEAYKQNAVTWRNISDGWKSSAEFWKKYFDRASAPSPSSIIDLPPTDYRVLH